MTLVWWCIITDAGAVAFERLSQGRSLPSSWRGGKGGLPAAQSGRPLNSDAREGSAHQIIFKRGQTIARPKTLRFFFVEVLQVYPSLCFDRVAFIDDLFIL